MLHIWQSCFVQGCVCCENYHPCESNIRPSCLFKHFMNGPICMEKKRFPLTILASLWGIYPDGEDEPLLLPPSGGPGIPGMLGTIQRGLASYITQRNIKHMTRPVYEWLHRPFIRYSHKLFRYTFVFTCDLNVTLNVNTFDGILVVNESFCLYFKNFDFMISLKTDFRGGVYNNVNFHRLFVADKMRFLFLIVAIMNMLGVHMMKNKK